MGRLIFKIEEDEREMLEVLRSSGGHRSEAATLRAMIRQDYEALGSGPAAGAVEGVQGAKKPEVPAVPADADHYQVHRPALSGVLPRRAGPV